MVSCETNYSNYSSISRPGQSRSRRSYGKKIDIARSLLEMGSPLRWLIACLLLTLATGVMAFNKMTVCSWMRRKNPGGNNLYCGWMPWRSRLSNEPSALVEQSVVAADYA